jgi:hypothetical protein
MSGSISQANASTTAVAGASLVVYNMVGEPQERDFKYKRLVRYNAQVPFAVQVSAATPGNQIATSTPANPLPEKVPDGWYDFVIRLDNPGVVFMQRDRETADLRSANKHAGDPDYIAAKKFQHAGSGHSSIAECQAVLFAGQIKFNAGAVEKWTNESGHYLTGDKIYNGKGDSSAAVKTHAAIQTQFAKTLDGAAPLLPIDKFEARSPRI